MKKHLIAAAVAATVAVPAMAQNVTVYGRIDAGYTDLDNKTSNTKGVRFNSHTTSRIGFTGTEDLGGGLKASFGLEGGLGVASSLTASTTQQSSSGSAYTVETNGTDMSFGGFNRAAWAELSGNFGAIRLGLTDSATKVIHDTYNVSGSSNTTGTANSILDGSRFATRNTAVRYSTPNFNGLSASLSVMSQETLDSAVNTGDKTKVGSGEEIAVSYVKGPLSLAAAYYNVEIARTSGSEDKANDGKQTSLGASYDFGAAKLFLVYGDTEVEATGGATKTESDVTEIGVSIPVSSAATIWGSYAQGEKALKDTTAYQLGARYSLSKRTYAYGVYGKTDFDNTQVKTDQMSVGIVHQF